MRLLDGPVGAIARGITWGRLSSPSVAGLTPLRRVAAERAWNASAAEARALAAGLSLGEPAAREALAALGERALGRMRAELRAEAGRRGLVHAVAAGLDARFGDTEQTEWLDDPEFDRDARVAVLEHLDRLNRMVGSYDAFFDALRPFLRRDGAATRVLDLAAGHGGFALEAARIARREGIPLVLRATDLKREYLDIGAEVARREGLDVSFEVQDALDLTRFAPGEIDVVICTQSLHHFPPGLVAVLAAEASRIAARAVVLIDGYRSRVHAALIGSLGLVRFGDVVFAHDAWVSFRRFFVPEEIGLLARLGPRGAHADARWAPPAHCVAVIRGPRAGD